KRTGNRSRLERYLSSFRVPGGAREILPRRALSASGVSVVRRERRHDRTEDLNVKIRQEAFTCNGNLKHGCCEAVAADEGSGRGLEAIARDRHAAFPGGCDDCGYDEGHRLAAALDAGLSCRRGSQAPQIEPHLEENRRHTGLSDQAPRRGLSPIQASLRLKFPCRASESVRRCLIVRRSISRLRSCAISMSSNCAAVGILRSAADRRLTFLAICCSAPSRTGCRPIDGLSWILRVAACSIARTRPRRLARGH